MTQTQRVLEFMKENGSITDNDARDYLKVNRLASRIYDISKMGFSVSRRTEYGINKYGKFRYTRYSLEV